MGKKVSIIVPIYNLEQYLKICLDSIAEQTYSNLEVLLIDDGSTDGSSQICNQYQEKDARFQAIHKKNGGAADARNMALDICTGDYITFVDGDDYIAKDFIEQLVSIMEEQGADISICGWNNVEGENVEPFCANTKEVKAYDTVSALEVLLYQEEFDSAMWPKLYKKELFDGIRFPKGNLYEDIAIIYHIFMRAKKVGYINYAGYFYLLRESGTTLKKFTKNKMDLIDVVSEMESIILKKYPQLEKAIASRVVRASFHIYMQIPETEEFATERARIEDIIKKRRAMVLKDGRTKRGTKAALLLSMMGFSFFMKFRNLKKLGKK